MKLIVGLGNPGKEYDKTRHNIGYMSIDSFLGNVNFKNKFNGLFYEKNYDHEKIIFLKPLTFMNNSGDCVREFVKYYDIDLKDIMVIQDDLDLMTGVIKFKINSSSGGHNGIKSIINNLHSDGFFRMKIGIKSDLKKDVIDYVLGKFSKSELDLIDFQKINNAVLDFINNDYMYVMNKYNGK